MLSLSLLKGGINLETGLSGAAEDAPFIRVEPSKGWVSLKLHELWEYRELLYFLVWRDIKVRYKQTALGAAWAIIQPFFTMIVFSLFFGKLAKMPSDGIPYPIFTFAALVPWTFFANGLSQASNSLVGSANLITKVVFPPPGDTDCFSAGRCNRLYSGLYNIAGHDALLRYYSDNQYIMVAAPGCTCLRYISWCVTLVFCS